MLPTPKAADGIMGRPRTSGRPIEKSTHLGTIVTVLPTPDAAMGDRGHSSTVGGRRPSGQPRQVDLNTVVVHFPTPRTTDANGAGKHGTGGLDLRTAITELPNGESMPLPLDVGNE